MWDNSVHNLEDYDLKVGDKIFVLVHPTSYSPCYSYKEARLIQIRKSICVHDKPNEMTKHYKAKMKMYERWMNKDECDHCKFTIQCVGDKYYREIDRKNLYMETELDILIEDIDKLNQVYAFKKKQEAEFNEYLEQTFCNWNYYKFEDRRKVKKECP